MVPSCWFFWAWSMWPMLAVAVAGQQAEGCSGSGNTCGNLTISDPFWLTDWETGRPCGSRDFQVTCYGSTPVLRGTSSIGFTIINITYEEHSLRAVDQGKLQLMQSSNSCYYTTWNTSVKLGSSFRISPTNLNLIMYICTTAAAKAVRRKGKLVETRTRCGNESEVFVRPAAGSYDETSDYGSYAVEGCEAIVVPVLGGANGKADASDYEQLISDGFLLSWDGLPPVPDSPRAYGVISKFGWGSIPFIRENGRGFLSRIGGLCWRKGVRHWRL